VISYSEEDRTRTLWKYFFPPENHTVHAVRAKARCRNHSSFVLCLYSTALGGHTSNGALISIRTVKYSQSVAGADIQCNPVTDLQVSPRRSPSLLGYTVTCDPRDSCAPSARRNYQPNTMRCGVSKGVGTRFIIVTGVGGG